jgi:hypothetical protein
MGPLDVPLRKHSRRRPGPSASHRCRSTGACPEPGRR